MNYELCKELKDAGLRFEYPQTRENTYSHLDPKGNPCSGLAMGSVYVPTLSELIEACGGFFFELIKLPNESWCAKESGDKGTGSTPEEAVARLWISLNKKPTV